MLELSGESLSVVLQGPVVPGSTAEGVPDIRESIGTIRALLPGAEIILSTWVGTPDFRPLCDVQINSPDPGRLGRVTRKKNYFANLNRQIVSTAAGLDRATRRHALKLRTDSTLAHTGLLELYARGVDAAKLAPTHFGQRILVNGGFSRAPCISGRLFWVSDVYQLGTTADLRSLWSIPLADARLAEWRPSGIVRWFSTRGLQYNSPEKLAAEQYVMVEFLRRKGEKFRFRSGADFCRAAYFTSERFIVRNFLPVTHAATGVRLPTRLETAVGKDRDYRVDPAFSLSTEEELDRLIAANYAPTRIRRINITAITIPRILVLNSARAAGRWYGRLMRRAAG